MKLNFSRVLLKLSGEVLAGQHSFGIDPNSTQSIAEKIKSLYDKNIQLGIVIGGVIVVTYLPIFNFGSALAK